MVYEKRLTVKELIEQMRKEAAAEELEMIKHFSKRKTKLAPKKVKK